MSEDPQAGATPDTQPGATPDTQPGAGPDTQPGAGPDTQPGAGPDTPVSPDASQDVALAGATRLTDLVAGRLADQARRTAQAARARRVANTGGEPGVLDLTPLRDLVSELADELRKVRPRERVARALRQAADFIDPPKPIH